MARRALLVASAAATAVAGPCSLLVNGQPAVVGTTPWNAQSSVVANNGLMEWHWSGQAGHLMGAYLDGMQFANNQSASWYVDWGGGSNGQVAAWNSLIVLRVGTDLVEWAFADTRHATLQHELHNIMTSDVRGIYGFNILHAVSATSISEVRHNTRWNRCFLNMAHNSERASHTLPTYAYLDTQQQVQDETWRIDGVNRANLPCPNDNAGNLPAGSVYTKYDYSLYHHENPIFGHMGAAPSGTFYGVFLTPLGGITNATSAAFYGVGPNHQDLAIHQDDIILNYFGANHYGLPGYPLPNGYRRLYGPWLIHVSTGPTADAMLAAANTVAQANIAQSHDHLPFIQHELYSQTRSNVTGTVVVSDGRPGGPLWALLSTQTDNVVYDLHESTYFVLTNAAGQFTIPGVPPGTYNLYVFSASGSITDVLRRGGVVVTAGVTALGNVNWTPSDAGYRFLWQIGAVDRMGGEFALGRAPREWYLPGQIPRTLTFTIGTSREATDWYYAQTQGGTWTVSFTLPQTYTGTGVLVVSASLTQGNSPTVLVNGVAPTGRTPTGGDSTLSRQTVRSGYPRLSNLTFPATLLRAGANTVTFTRAASGNSNNTGMGYDSVILLVNGAAESDAEGAAAQLATTVVRTQLRPDGSSSWRVVVRNDGAAHAMLPRLEAFEFVTAGTGNAHASSSRPSFVGGRDPHVFPLPVAAFVAPGSAVALDVELDPTPSAAAASPMVRVRVVADGGRVSADAIVSAVL